VRHLLRLSLGILLVLQGLSIAVALERPAYGYVDPGSGLLLFQIGGSMFAGAIFFLRTRIRKFFGFASKGENPSTSSNPVSSVIEPQR
jgi:hypothetical protein